MKFFARSSTTQFSKMRNEFTQFLHWNFRNQMITKPINPCMSRFRI
ncbi:hypothetical protein X975_10540, partial [Stegodyphus mimosarum]